MRGLAVWTLHIIYLNPLTRAGRENLFVCLWAKVKEEHMGNCGNKLFKAPRALKKPQSAPPAILALATLLL